MQIVISVIAVAIAKPADYNSQYDEPSVSVSGESDEKPEEVVSNYPAGVFTKYPDDPYDSFKADDDALSADEVRIRRNVDCNETDPSIDLTKQPNNSEDVKRDERKTDEQAKVPLRGFIRAIESDLMSKALEVNAQLRKRRSTERIVSDEDDEDVKLEKTNQQNSTTDAVDVNKNFFEGLFDFTRPERETEDKTLKIPLDDLVQAVETTLVQSAKNLKEQNHSKRDISSEESDESNEDTINETKPSKKPEIKIEKIAPSSSLNLNLLNPIAFKSVSMASASEQSTASDEELISTTEIPIQKTNLTVLQASNSLRLVPSFDNKLAHVQRQEISKTVFHSSLAIFPTIPPHVINAPLPYVTTTEEAVDTTVAVQTSSSTVKSEEETKHEQLLEKAEKLKEKIAEIQAEPVILSQF